MTTLERDEAAYFDLLHRAESAHWWSIAMARIATLWLDRVLRGRAGLRALDIGCGAGGTLRQLARRAEVEGVIGIDPSPRALRFAREGDVLVGSALALPIAADSVDVATCFDVLQHLPRGEDRRALSEIARVLRPGGVALLRTNGAGLWPDPHAADRPYRLREVVALARGSGLKVVLASYANGLPAVAAELAGRLRRGSSDGHPQGRGLRLRIAGPRWRDRLMALVSTAEALAVGRLGVRLPIGHSVMVLAEKPPGDRA